MSGVLMLRWSLCWFYIGHKIIIIIIKGLDRLLWLRWALTYLLICIKNETLRLICLLVLVKRHLKVLIMGLIRERRLFLVVDTKRRNESWRIIHGFREPYNFSIRPISTRIIKVDSSFDVRFRLLWFWRATVTNCIFNFKIIIRSSKRVSIILLFIYNSLRVSTID